MMVRAVLSHSVTVTEYSGTITEKYGMNTEDHGIFRVPARSAPFFARIL
ncbi:hypothetical protein [Paracoccus sp. pheM1]|nr:hypothetical protein [Paracoccus sp. pheM1]MBT0779565.1 hypothetical protein [Paracoccus sp. pheM1]